MKESNLMTVTEVAEYLRCHPTTIYKLLKKGDIPAFRVGTDWRFKPEAINEWREGLTNRIKVQSPSGTSARQIPITN